MQAKGLSPKTIANVHGLISAAPGLAPWRQPSAKAWQSCPAGKENRASRRTRSGGASASQRCRRTGQPATTGRATKPSSPARNITLASGCTASASSSAEVISMPGRQLLWTPPCRVGVSAENVDGGQPDRSRRRRRTGNCESRPENHTTGLEILSRAGSCPADHSSNPLYGRFRPAVRTALVLALSETPGGGSVFSMVASALVLVKAVLLPLAAIPAGTTLVDQQVTSRDSVAVEVSLSPLPGGSRPESFEVSRAGRPLRCPLSRW
jgi:hypothetical protein